MDKPKKNYSARVRLDFVGGAKPRYLKSQSSAVSLFREINQRLMQQGQPPREAKLEPVRGWTGLLDPCHLSVTSSGGVVVRRPARRDDFHVAAPVWPAMGA